MNRDLPGTPDAPRTQRYYHGTRADLDPGDSIEPCDSRHVRLTPDLDEAIWDAEIAAGDDPPRVYTVEPTGPVEDDPDLTDKKFRGNPTKAFRSREPLRVTGEVEDWPGHPPEKLQAMKDWLAQLEQGGEPIDDRTSEP